MVKKAMLPWNTVVLSRTMHTIMQPSTGVCQLQLSEICFLPLMLNNEHTYVPITSGKTSTAIKSLLRFGLWLLQKNIPSLHKFYKYIRCTTCSHYDIVFSWHGTMHNFLRFKFNSQTNRAFNPISKLIKRSVCFRCLGGGLLISWSSYCFPFVV